MADCTTIDARLAEARKAYHEIMTGAAVSRFIDQNGESVQYTRSNPGALQSYIARLEAEKLECSGNTFSAHRGPLKFTYGRRC